MFRRRMDCPVNSGNDEEMHDDGRGAATGHDEMERIRVLGPYSHSRETLRPLSPRAVQCARPVRRGHLPEAFG